MPDAAKLKTIALMRTAKITVSNAMASPTVPGPQKVLLFDLTGESRGPGRRIDFG